MLSLALCNPEVRWRKGADNRSGRTVRCSEPPVVRATLEIGDREGTGEPPTGGLVAHHCSIYRESCCRPAVMAGLRCGWRSGQEGEAKDSGAAADTICGMSSLVGSLNRTPLMPCAMCSGPVFAGCCGWR